MSHELARSRPELRLRVGAATSPGRRSANEDAYRVGPHLVTVADGVGGVPGGALAARTAVTTVVALAQGARRSLSAVVAAANAAVRSGRRDPALAGMSSTVDLVRLVRRGEAAVLELAHLGDGAVFLQQPNGPPRRLTTPHRTLAADGERLWLERALGCDEQALAQYERIFAGVGQRLVLTTDGLLDHLGDAGLCALLDTVRVDTPQTAADLLTAAGAEAGDNVTVVVADVDLAGGRP